MPRPALLKDYNILFFDSETGGLDPQEADFVEVAAILTDPTGSTVIEEYSARVFPKKPVHPKAAAVNGYTPEAWATTAVELDGPMVKLLSMARDSVMCGHNVSFDWNFFEKAMKQRNQRWTGDYHKYDTVALAVPLLRHGLVPNLKLTTLTQFYGIEHEAHRALGDVKACREVYLRLMSVYDGITEKLAATRAA